MGLETLELMMDIEDNFEIRITDDDAAAAVTIDQVCDLILLCIERQHNGRTHVKSEIFNWLADLLAREYKIPLSAITPKAELIKDLGLG